MNSTQIQVLAAFESTMQTFTDVWNSKVSTPQQRIAAFGGAAAMLLLARRTTDIKDTASHAAMLLNQAAGQLGLPRIH